MDSQNQKGKWKTGTIKLNGNDNYAEIANLVKEEEKGTVLLLWIYCKTANKTETPAPPASLEFQLDADDLLSNLNKITNKSSPSSPAPAASSSSSTENPPETKKKGTWTLKTLRKFTGGGNKGDSMKGDKSDTKGDKKETIFSLFAVQHDAPKAQVSFCGKTLGKYVKIIPGKSNGKNSRS